MAVNKKAAKRGGRSSAELTTQAKTESRVQVQSSREERAHNPNRPARVSLQALQQLDVGGYNLDRVNYSYRWFSDKPGRIGQAQGAYWEQCNDENGNAICRKGGLRTSHLMRIEMKYFIEDQDLKKQKRRDKIEDIAKVDKSAGEYTSNTNGLAVQKDGTTFDPLAPN